MFDLDHRAVRAQRTPLGTHAPALFAYLEKYGPGQVFRSHGMQLQVQPLHGLKFVALLAHRRPLLAYGVVAPTVFAHKISAVNVVKRELPAALDLKIYRPALACSAQQHSRRQQKCRQFFHVIAFLRCFVRVQPSMRQ